MYTKELYWLSQFRNDDIVIFSVDKEMSQSVCNTDLCESLKYLFPSGEFESIYFLYCRGLLFQLFLSIP